MLPISIRWQFRHGKSFSSLWKMGKKNFIINVRKNLPKAICSFSFSVFARSLLGLSFHVRTKKRRKKGSFSIVDNANANDKRLRGKKWTFLGRWSHRKKVLLPKKSLDFSSPHCIDFWESFGSRFSVDRRPFSDRQDSNFRRLAENRSTFAPNEPKKKSKWHFLEGQFQV